MKDDILDFGKYKGESILNVSADDPSYIVWLSENNIIGIDEDILTACLYDTMSPDWETLNPDWGDRD